MTNLSNIVEVLAQQALGGNQQAAGQGGLGGILGSVLGQMGGNTSSGAQGGLGGVLGSVLGQVTGNNNAPQAGSGVQSLLIAVVPLILGNYKAYLTQQILSKLPSRLKRQKNRFMVRSHLCYLRLLTL